MIMLPTFVMLLKISVNIKYIQRHHTDLPLILVRPFLFKFFLLIYHGIPPSYTFRNITVTALNIASYSSQRTFCKTLKNSLWVIDLSWSTVPYVIICSAGSTLCVYHLGSRKLRKEWSFNLVIVHTSDPKLLLILGYLCYIPAILRSITTITPDATKRRTRRKQSRSRGK